MHRADRARDRDLSVDVLRVGGQDTHGPAGPRRGGRGGHGQGEDHQAVGRRARVAQDVAVPAREGPRRGPLHDRTALSRAGLGRRPVRQEAPNHVPNPGHERAPDLVHRRFFAPVPNRLWVADFTQVATWSGKVYIAFVIDAYSRRIVGWRVAPTMSTALVLDALEHALHTRAAAGVADVTGLISHSDAGSQYTSLVLTSRLVEAGADPSVGSVGDALDNALAETTVGSFKTELIRRQGPWRDIDHVEIETMTWVDFFNTERPHEYLDDLTPVTVENLHYAQPQQAPPVS